MMRITLSSRCPMALTKTVRKAAAAASVLCLLAFCRPLWADEITMINGDRMTGRIVRMENKALILASPYAGEVTIQWKQVKAVDTDGPVLVVWDDGTSAHGILVKAEKDMVRLEQPEAAAEPMTFSMAQVKAINPVPERAVKVTGRVNAGLDVKKGNTETEAVHLDGDLGARTEWNRFVLRGEVNQEEERDMETADNWLLYGNFDRFLTRKWFFYAATHFEHDHFKDIDLRTTIGGGSGYQFFESEERNLSLRGGLAYVNVDYSTGSRNDDFGAAIWNVTFDHYFLEGFLQFFHLQDGSVDLEDVDEIVIRTRTGIRVPLPKGFRATLRYDWDWDNAPVAGNDKVDERYLVTLGYAWD